MADVFTKAKRSQVMAAIRSTGNKATEQRLAALFRLHHITGWRRHLKLPGTPDFAFPKQKIAVFVDGCFWHGCPKHGHKPQSNRDFWLKKLAQNQKRDRLVARNLKNKSWKVIRIWEHELGRLPKGILSHFHVKHS
jgi:DNA mismatch endonuclease (patch repair protein)